MEQLLASQTIHREQQQRQPRQSHLNILLLMEGLPEHEMNFDDCLPHIILSQAHRLLVLVHQLHFSAVLPVHQQGKGQRKEKQKKT